MKNRINKLIWICFCSIPLTSCVPVRGHPYRILDFDNYSDLIEDLEFQNSIYSENQFNIFDYHLPDATTDYHVSGIDWTDNYIMKGYDIPADKKIFKSRCVFVVNRSSSQNLVVSYANNFDKNIGKDELRWIMVLDNYQKYDDVDYPYEHKSIDAAQTQFMGRIDDVTQIFALVNKDNQRLIWVGSSKGKEGFELVKSEIENITIEVSYDD